MKRMVHKIGEYTYKGSLNISYLKYYRDSNGKLCSSRVNETLHAEVKKTWAILFNHGLSSLWK